MTVTSLAHVVNAVGGEHVQEALRVRRDELREALHRDGAVLLRGFAVGGPDGLDAAVREFSGAPLTYTERSSPRTVIKGNIYTSTEYPADAEIFLHNENSYQSVWPGVLYFHCVQPPRTGGATPLADTRHVLELIDRDVVDEFDRRGWMVVRNFHQDLGLAWQEVFGTSDRAEVERYCAEHAITVTWTDGDGLRTKAVRAAIHSHPVTGARVWFNHATVFHVSTLPEVVRVGLLEMFGSENLPSNTYFGDGAPIPDDMTEHLRDCYRKASTRFDYARDDVVIVDNMLTAHGREPFTGPRTIAVAMAEPSQPRRS